MTKPLRLSVLLLTLVSASNLTQCATPLLLAGAAAGVGYYMGAERRIGDVISQDAAAERYVIEQLQKRHIDTDRLKIMAYNHRLLLVGRVPSREQAMLIESIARKAPHITRVYNRLEIGPPLTTQQKANDAWLMTKVKAALIARKGLTSASIRFTVFNGVVYLMGLVTKEEAWRAIDASRKVAGVRKVVDAMERYVPEEKVAPDSPAIQPAPVATPPVRSAATPSAPRRPAASSYETNMQEVLEIK